MPGLPGHASLEHLKNQAKTLLARARAGEEHALGLVAAHHPNPPAALKLADAQLVVARAYGFASWPKLRAHLELVVPYSRSPHEVGELADPQDEYLRLACLTYSNDDPARMERARNMDVTPESLHVAAAMGDVAAAQEHIADVNVEAGPHRWTPLLYLAYARVGTGEPLAVARLLLDAGADPNAGFLWDGLPSPFTALTGAFGRGEGDPPPHPDELALARALLGSGADPNDTQATYNVSWTEGDAWLELLLEFGYGQGDGGPWHALLGDAHASPRENAEDCLTWAAYYGFPRRVALLLDAGVDPDGRGTRHPLLENRTALATALLRGHAAVAERLREHGATEPELTPAQTVEAAYMRADPSVTAPPPPGLLIRAAESGRADAVALLLERGADPDFRHRATALHEAALRGDRTIVDLLLAAGADRTIKDTQFDATPAGWADHAGHTALAEYLNGS